jgi:outer membrane receptor protein involved in Fe transport
MSSLNLFAQAGVTHTAHSFTQSGSNPVLSAGSNISTNQLRFENPPYTLYDVSCGVTKEAWSVELYALNLTNVIKSTFTSDSQFSLQENIMRPRVLGAKIGYKF